MWGKVAIGLRSFGVPAPEFLQSWTRMIRGGLADGDEVLDIVARKPIVPASNALVESFMETLCDSLLIMDDDMVFEPDTLKRLRAGGEKYGIYSVLYASRRFPHFPLVFRSANKSLNSTKNLGGDIDVEFVGMGFTLIRRSVFEQLRKNYMADDVFSWNRSGEDGAICGAARKIGFKVGVNSDISVGHISADPIYWNPETDAYETREFK